MCNRIESLGSIFYLRRWTAFLLGCACLVCLKTQAQTDLKAATPYVQRRHGFSIQFPLGWRVKDKGTKTVVKATKVLPNGKYDASILIHADSPGRLTNTWEVSPEKLYRSEQTTLLDSGRMELNGLKATWLKCPMELPIFGKRTAIAYLIIVNNRLIKITCFAPPEKFERYSPVFERTAKSFRKLATR